MCFVLLYLCQSTYFHVFLCSSSHQILATPLKNHEFAEGSHAEVANIGVCRAFQRLPRFDWFLGGIALMRPVATDVACYVVCTCMYVCIGHTGDACRMDEQIEMPASRATNEPYTLYLYCSLGWGTKVCRYNWHSAGSLGWPFPMLIYFSNKICGSNFIEQHSETVTVWNYHNVHFSLKKINLLCHLFIIFGTPSY